MFSSNPQDYIKGFVFVILHIVIQELCQSAIKFAS
jgi:hypothetical protein